MSLEILRSIITATNPQPVTPLEMPPRELRFVIELQAAPDVQAVHNALTAALASDKFVLEPLFADAQDPLDRFLLLRIVGAERTLPADVLFEVAYALATELGAVSVEPDVGSRFYEDPAPPIEGPRSENAEAVRGWCNADAEPPVDRRWALNTVRAPDAWEADQKQGEAVLVAQPDTGVVPIHPELGGALEMALAHNVLEPDQPPIDPLNPSMANPGHGTATASCVTSRLDGVMAGSAPLARVVPIRCIDDVKVFDAAPVARAIDHARRSGCHVITMSLGGVPSRALRAALDAAVAADLIVLAAAGNCVKFVVWPARYDNCIAVAGTNIDDVPWKGSCRGSAVDVSAPAENVWKADARAQHGVTAGQGTSFAVAITAGAAALWLAHHGRDALIAEARRRGVHLQDLFRSALMQTARQPAGWDAADFGAGIVNAAELQALKPSDIRIVRRESAVPRTEVDEIAELITELTGEPAVTLPANFDWRRYGLELANVTMERSRRESRARSGAASEAGLQAFRPSQSLTRALAGTTSPPLEAVRGARANAFAPARRTQPKPASRTVRILASRARDDTREASRPPMSAREGADVLSQRGDELVGKTLDRLEQVGDSIPTQAHEVETLLDVVERHGRAAITSLAAGATEAQLPSQQRTALEALVALTGRPALRVSNGTIDFADPNIGEWDVPLLLLKDEIPKIVESVGRIDVGGEHTGTGFMIGPDLVMTNRHVLEVIAVPAPTSFNPQRWILAQEAVTIDFLREVSSPKQRRFSVVDVVFAGPTPTNDTDFVDFKDLDLAVLRIGEPQTPGDTPPPALSFLKGELNTHGNDDVLVVGYPARPFDLPRDAQGKVRQDVVDALMRIYGLHYGVKYLSPGEVTEHPGSIAGDAERWVFAHDASTLGGNSGSCVVRYGPKPGIIGLHFAGEFERANYAHAMHRLVTGRHLPDEIVELVQFVEE